ncbi:guanitoxin biosynthesis MBL fold metallo-hydrolase GntH [Amorphus coralli]|uniref:guanitoxin biosynthesis MBL fold metallo-hydrolase GntH n=1 Tax=Amorphus coralli TaxID=340680 RepID=UPI0003800B45|nr:guanitoxin biosynthesis MBL fold metallo-hydrolase GntH [Amorphus coralli]
MSDENNTAGASPEASGTGAHSRRDFMKVGAAGAAALGVSATGASAAETTATSASAATEPAVTNPYGPSPGGGISLPDYFKPWPAIKNNNFYMPGTETLPKNEMRISFLGSTPWPPTQLQSGTSILVELGTGEDQPRRFFFDMGNGSIRNAIAMQVPAPLINDIFLTHLHADHYADLPYMYPFRAFSGGFTPLRVYGPSGRTPELGIKHMVKHMREMNRWHEENFNACPIGDGFEIDVTEFDWKQENGIVYDQDGVKVRSWPRSHVKDGAVAYRLDWEDAGLSFVFTGDGRPDELSAKYGKGADVFVSEGTIDVPKLSAMKLGAPAELWEYTIDIFHTMYYAAGYLFKQTQPRMAAICHYEYAGEALEAESVAEVRANWDGLFMFGGPDVQVVNVSKDAIWSREANLPKGAAPAAMDPRWFLKPGEALPETISLPTPRLPREEQQEQFVRDLEIDPHKYYPPDVYRKPVQTWPGVTLNPREMLAARGIKVDD